jgi:hypothetical protein
MHVEGCDVARCANNGRQRLQCDCDDGCNTLWTGAWPGEAECIEFGWYARFRPTEGGWQQCGPDDEGAGPDLNRLANPVGEAVWDKAAGRYVLRQPAGSTHAYTAALFAADNDRPEHIR